jgi:PIN domain nuclease of toxin-antitoxin system
LSKAQARVLAAVTVEQPLLVSDITLWEIATLLDLGRIHLDLPLLEWLEKATENPYVKRCGISPSVAAEVARLPATFQRDPADRIIVSTARVYGATLVTSDQRIVGASLVPVQL